MCLLVTNKRRSEEPWFVLTGDTLSVGAIGRPDLAGRSREMAAPLYHSLRSKLLNLPNAVELYPGYQAGSVCGAGLSGKPRSAIGFEKRFNPLLGIQDSGAFVERVVNAIPAWPADWKRILAANTLAA
jgi:hydroxyacylglutathione hydrolase